MAEQILCKGRAALIAEEVRKTLDGLGVVGQRMGLLVRDHLQPVLDLAQKLVGFGQFLARLKRDPVAGRENLQRVQRGAHPQLRMTAAGNQLLCLREKLDLADAAAADLDVMALDRDLALAAIGLHLPLHVMDVGQCRKIQMLAPDERREFGDQRLARFGVAGARPRLDHRRAFPGSPFPLVIMQRRVGRNRHLRRGRIGPQAQIDAEHVAVARALLQQTRERLRHAHEERRRLDVGDQRGGGGIEKHDQVDVAGIVQFAGAHLAHGEHDQAGALLRPVMIDGRHPAARDLLAQQEAQGRLHRDGRKIGQRRRHPHHRPDPADVAQRDQQRGFRLHAAKQMHHIGLACGGQHVARGLFDQRVRDAVPGRTPATGPAVRHRRGSDRTDRARTRRCRAEWPWRTGDPATRRWQPIARARVRRANLPGAVRHCWQQRYAAR